MSSRSCNSGFKVLFHQSPLYSSKVSLSCSQICPSHAAPQERWGDPPATIHIGISFAHSRERPARDTGPDGSGVAPPAQAALGLPGRSLSLHPNKLIPSTNGQLITSIISCFFSGVTRMQVGGQVWMGERVSMAQPRAPGGGAAGSPPSSRALCRGRSCPES